MSKKSNTIAIKKTHFYTAIVVLLVVFAGFAGYALGNTGSATVAADDAAPQRIQVSTDDDPFLGSEDAPVTVIEFSDFECPFCQRAYTDAVAGLKRDYVETGKVKFVYRDFPLSFHPEAAPAAEAAECANEQGKFWEFHDQIFENQESMGDSFYKQTAADLGLNTEQFNECVDTGKYQAEVENDQADGSAAGVSGTPTFFIGNDEDGYIPVVGAQPYSVIKQVVDSEL